MASSKLQNLSSDISSNMPQDASPDITRLFSLSSEHDAPIEFILSRGLNGIVMFYLENTSATPKEVHETLSFVLEDVNNMHIPKKKHNKQQSRFVLKRYQAGARLHSGTQFVNKRSTPFKYFSNTLHGLTTISEIHSTLNDDHSMPSRNFNSADIDEIEAMQNASTAPSPAETVKQQLQRLVHATKEDELAHCTAVGIFRTFLRYENTAGGLDVLLKSLGGFLEEKRKEHEKKATEAK